MTQSRKSATMVNDNSDLPEGALKNGNSKMTIVTSQKNGNAKMTILTSQRGLSSLIRCDSIVGQNIWKYKTGNKCVLIALNNDIFKFYNLDNAMVFLLRWKFLLWWRESPGRSPQFRQFQHQTPSFAGDRGSPAIETVMLPMEDKDGGGRISGSGKIMLIAGSWLKGWGSKLSWFWSSASMVINGGDWWRRQWWR